MPRSRLSGELIDRLPAWLEALHAFLKGTTRIIQTNPTTRKDNFHIVLNGFGPDHLVILLYFFL